LSSLRLAVLIFSQWDQAASGQRARPRAAANIRDAGFFEVEAAGRRTNFFPRGVFADRGRLIFKFLFTALGWLLVSRLETNTHEED